jgi:WD40 repeat protein
MVVAVSNGSLGIWNAHASEAPVIISGAHCGAVLCIACHPKGLIATGGADRAMQFWEVSSGKRLGGSCMHGSAILQASFSPDGAMLVAVGLGGEVMVWDCPRLPEAV